MAAHSTKLKQAILHAPYEQRNEIPPMATPSKDLRYTPHWDRAEER